METIDELFERAKSKVKIEDEASKYIELKKTGPYLKGNCPIKEANVPCGKNGFTVSIPKQIFYCFGCHEGGDVISFIGRMQNKSPLEVIEDLCPKGE